MEAKPKHIIGNNMLSNNSEFKVFNMTKRGGKKGQLLHKQKNKVLTLPICLISTQKAHIPSKIETWDGHSHKEAQVRNNE